MNVTELFDAQYRTMLLESVFDVLDSIPLRGVEEFQVNTLAALVMFIQTNNQRPGIVQLMDFYRQDNVAMRRELDRIIKTHPEDFQRAREYVRQHNVADVKQYIHHFFSNKQHNNDLVPRSARPEGPRLPQRPVGGDKGKLKMAGR